MAGGWFDLIVLSEVAYYCGPDDLGRVISAAAASLTGDGVLVACHWRQPVVDYPVSGDEVHRRIRQESGLVALAEHVEEDFRLDVLVRPPAISVARRDGAGDVTALPETLPAEDPGTEPGTEPGTTSRSEPVDPRDCHRPARTQYLYRYLHRSRFAPSVSSCPLATRSHGSPGAWTH